MDKWNNKIAVVTGASSGIGAAIIKELAKNGLTVIGLARRVENVEEIAKEFDGKIFAYKCDIGDLNSIKAVFKWIEEKFEKIHIIINNAGMIAGVRIFDEGEEAEQKMISTIDVNFTGLVHCTREAVGLIKKSEDYGMIINIGSIRDSNIPFTSWPTIYPPTKHAVRAFSEVARQELIVSEHDKIKVSNISPGLVKTGILSDQSFYDSRPHLSSDDVAQSVVYLLSTPHNVNVTQLTIKPVGEKE